MQKVHLELGVSSRTYSIAVLLFLKSECVYLKLRVLLPVDIHFSDFCMKDHLTWHPELSERTRK